jgi:hypothetical protein
VRNSENSWLGLFVTLHINLNGSERNSESKNGLDSSVWFGKGCLEGWESLQSNLGFTLH